MRKKLLFGICLLLLFVSFRIRDGLTILILGIMFSSGLAAIISIMQYFSRADLCSLPDLHHAS